MFKNLKKYILKELKKNMLLLSSHKECQQRNRNYKNNLIETLNLSLNGLNNRFEKNNYQ